LGPQDLKLGVTDALNALLEPIRQEFANNPKFQESLELAYPKPGKKVKKVKDKGSKYPGKNANMKTGDQGANAPASEEIAENTITNNLEVGNGENKAQIQSAEKGVEDALHKLSVSDTPK
jgi:hypothetical protein